MSIEAEVTVTIAAVEITDEYQVGLSTPESRKHLTALTVDEARRLADELYEAARDAEAKLQEDRRRWADSTAQHGFDVDGPVAS
jgi:hypothetical protein